MRAIGEELGNKKENEWDNRCYILPDHRLYYYSIGSQASTDPYNSDDK